MRDLKHVVVYSPAGLDPSGALARARQLVATAGTVTVVDVLPELPALARAVLPPSLDTMHLKERERELVDAVRDLPDGAGRVRVLVMAGNAAARLTRFVADEGVGLVLKVSPGAITDASLDALDMKLLRKCPCPVWIAAAGPARRLNVVLAAVDVFTPPADAPLQESIIRCAGAAALSDDATVHVVNVWHVHGEHLLRRHLSVTDLQNHVQETRKNATGALRALLGRAEQPNARPHLVRGEPPSAIARTAAKVGADLLVMGTVARTGLPGLIIGNTAESVLAAVHCEVLVVKPAGFVSPLMAQEASTAAVAG